VAASIQTDLRGFMRRATRRSSTLVVLAVLSGCSIFTPVAPPPAPPPELPPIVTPEPEPVPLPEPVAEPAPEPEPEPLPPQQNIKPRIAVVLSESVPAYVDVADALGGYLDNYKVYDLSDRGLPAREAFDEIAASDAAAVVAIGLPAARAARRFATVPVVLGQVFNLQESDLVSDDMRAVAVLPPIALQVDAWQSLDPALRNIGAILGPGHEDLIAETEAALLARGIKFHHAVAQSDRETLYLFNRLVRDIDGFILFPDNRILSRTVLTEMMSYASRHRVQVAVFNPPLLELGATFSAGAVESDIAAQIAAVLEKATSGRWSEVPPLTPLTEMDFRTNPAMLRRLGLEATATDLAGTLAEVQ